MTNALNTLEVSYFRVAIDVASLTPAGPVETLGGVDNITPEQHGVLTDFPSTFILSLQKERANMRFEEILRQVSEKIQPLFVSSIVNDATEDTPVTSPFEFTLSYDRPEYLRTEDEFNLGTFFTGDAAIKRWVERAITATIIQNRNVFDPDNTNPPSGVFNNAPQMIEVTADSADAGVLTAPIAEVTVTEVANIT